MKSLATQFKFATALVVSVQALELASEAQSSAGKEWKSGEVMTHETFRYGKFIAKIKGDDKLGTCTSFFTFWKGDSNESWSRYGWSEIDVELVPSAYHGTLSTNIIWQNQQMSSSQVDRAIADPEDGWATYEFQWTPDWVSWLYNGQERRKVWRSDENPEIEWLQEREQHLMMNFWIPNFADWNEGFDPAGMPWYAKYDFVEYWEYVPPEDWDSTPGANQWHPFKYGWKDDFDTFDESRWYASENWSFHENDVTFWRSQVYAEDGNLVLKLEPRDGSANDDDNGQNDSGDNADNDGENGGDGDGNNDNSSGCGCEDLMATIEQLREQLAAFQETCGDGSSNGGTDGNDNGGTDGNDNGTDGNDNGGNDGNDNGGNDGGSDGTDDSSNNTNFELQFAGTATTQQRNNVHYHDNSDSEQNINDSKLRFINRAPNPIWINYQAEKMLWPQTLRIDPGRVMDYEVNESVSATRFWPKYQCDENGQNCAFGESGGPELPCPPSGCSPPIDSKFEATFGATHGLDWYNASQVDGWTLPYEMKFDCEDDTNNSADLDCTGLTQSSCPTQTIDGAGTDVSLTAFNPDFNNEYAGCYSPCALLTYRNWYNPYSADNTPSSPPADKYCCAGEFDEPHECWTGPNENMTYTQVVHDHCDTYAWAYDDAVGLKACPSEKVTFTVTFYDPFTQS